METNENEISEEVVKPATLKNSFAAHGEELEEVITNKPPFIVRWGTLLLFLLLCAAAAVSWFIKYPDIVPVNAKLVSVNAPKPVVSITGGRLIKLFVAENDTVTNNQLVGFIESTANHNDVLQIVALIDSMNTLLLQDNVESAVNYFQSFSHPSSQYFPLRGIEGALLGELQPAFQIFMQAQATFKNYLANGFYLRKKKMLATDMANLLRMHSNLNKQQQLQQQDLALTQKTFEANQSLHNDSVISSFDLRNEKSKLINKKLTIPQLSIAIITNETQQNEKRKETAELENTIAQQKNIFQQALHTFKSQLSDWKRKYILYAPINGRVSFTSFIQENQQIAASQTICFINPGNSLYYAQAVIPQNNFGKIKSGQKILLKFPAYPFREFGSVYGSVGFISNVATDSGYLIKINLPQGLQTNYQINIPFKEGLIATGEIITKDMRLLQRFYYSVFNWQ